MGDPDSASGKETGVGAPWDAWFVVPGQYRVAFDFDPEQACSLSGSDLRAAVAACALLLGSPMDDVKMTDVAEASRVGVATLYRHFSTKAQLVVAAGTLMWGYLNSGIRMAVEHEKFIAMDGATRLETMLRIYASVYVENPGFVRFLDEFDSMVREVGPDTLDLTEYSAQLDAFYVLFDDVYQMGLADGSITHRVAFRTYYLAVGHALMGVAEKLMAGDVIPSDHFDKEELAAELDVIIRMAVHYMHAE